MFQEVLVREDNGRVGPELEFLKTELEKQTAQGQLRQSDLSAVITGGLKNFDSNPLAAKVWFILRLNLQMHRSLSCSLTRHTKIL